MDEITVEKAKLLETLKANREEHQQTYERAYEKYCETAQQALAERLSKFELTRDGDKPDLKFDLVEPRSFTDSFDTAIAMLEWSQDTTVTLGERDFKRFVLNQWEWQQQFHAVNSTYLG